MSERTSAVVTIFLIIVMILISCLIPAFLGVGSLLWVWLGNLVLMIVVLGLISLTKKTPNGFWRFLVDERNMVSLSRFQLILWTVVIISSLLTIGFARVTDAIKMDRQDEYYCAEEAEETEDAEDMEEMEEGEEGETEEEECKAHAPLDLKIPAILFALMGISLTSGVASPLIKGNIEAMTSTEGEDEFQHDRMNNLISKYAAAHVNQARGRNKKQEKIEDEFYQDGAIVKRKLKYPAKFSDMFMGETTGNFLYLDPAKIQNFFFTVLTLVGYAVLIGTILGASESIASLYELPDLSEGLVALLGISHAGYLTKKVTTK